MRVHRPGRFLLQAVVSLAIFAGPSWAATRFPAGTFVNGEWGVTFSADKTYHVTQNGEVVVEGVYTVGHDGVVFADKQGRYACSDSDGKYTWNMHADSLTFVKIEDQCQGRIGVLTGQPLVRQASK